MTSFIDRYIEEFLDNPELQAKILVYGQYLVLAMVVLGYLIMIYLLFFNK